METVMEALEGAGQGRGQPTGQQVHRYTKTARGKERAFWQPFNPKHRAQILAAAERYDRVQRLAHRSACNGRENGALGHVGLEVLRELLRLIDYKTGRLDPAIATLARRIGRSIAGVVAALKRLRDHGFLDWLRRYVPTGQAGIRGPQVQQTSNAYRICLPVGILAGLASPPPDDDSHRRAIAVADDKTMIASLPLSEQARAVVMDKDLAAILARLGAAIEQTERDSRKQNESIHH